MKNIFTEYTKNIKDFRLEEPMDYVLFRPLSYIIVRSTYSLPLTPNHFSVLGLVSAILAGYFLSLGTADGFVYGGIGIIAFSIFDCCDGMLARMKKNGSEYGDLIDMFVDVVSSISFYVGLFIGLGKESDLESIKYLSLVSAFAILFHVGTYNFYKTLLFDYLDNNPDARKRKVDQFKRDLEKLNNVKGKFFTKMILNGFIFFSKSQKEASKVTKYDVAKYRILNINILPLWGIISGSTHLFILAVSLIFHQIGYYFFYALIFGNIWAILIFFIQNGVNHNAQVVSE